MLDALDAQNAAVLLHAMLGRSVKEVVDQVVEGRRSAWQIILDQPVEALDKSLVPAVRFKILDELPRPFIRQLVKATEGGNSRFGVFVVGTRDGKGGHLDWGVW